MANGIKNAGQKSQLCPVRKPKETDCSPVPKYTKPSVIPEAVAVSFLPPKSAAAVPDIKEWIAIDRRQIATAHVPTARGFEYNVKQRTNDKTNSTEYFTYLTDITTPV